MVKEAGLRSAGAIRVGSIPTACNKSWSSLQNDHYRYSLVVRIGLFHSLGPSSILGIGVEFGASLQKAPGDQHDYQRIHTAISCL